MGLIEGFLFSVDHVVMDAIGRMVHHQGKGSFMKMKDQLSQPFFQSIMEIVERNDQFGSKCLQEAGP